MSRNLLLLLLLLANLNLLSQTVLKKKHPNWITDIKSEDVEEKDGDGAFKYLLLDFQDNIQTQEQFIHYAVKVLNSEGIQEFSDISISFDPSFQSLVFNQISVVRSGKKIDKLKESKINTYQRETNLERSLYDGSVTASINLSDIRKGDIIEYSYTITGYNPINKGNYSAVLYQQYTSPVNRIYHRILSSRRSIFFKLIDGAKEPEIKISTNGKEYVWDNDGSDNFQYDIAVPYWLNLQKRVAISTFKDWKEVSALTVPLFDQNQKTLFLPQGLNLDELSEEDKIIKMIRFVQDEVRYLGFESGIGAYKPNNPRKVLAQRYGDCKDKSLLLVNLLNNEGVTAYPLLVNTETKFNTEKLVPSHSWFNHCIVNFEFNGKSFYIDPTATNQGGNIENLSFPNYGSGLLVKKGESELIRIPENNIVPSLSIEETISTDSIGGSAIFLIKSIYSGNKANEMRNYFNSSSEENINSEFINFYSALYPSISSSQPIRFTDNQRNGKNEVVIEEYYNIDAFWVKNEQGNLNCETQPLVLQSLIDYSNSPQRSMPYYLGTPYNFKQETTIRLPDYWDITESNLNIDEDSFEYNRDIKSIGKTVKITHEYKLKKQLIKASETSSFLKKHEKISNEIAYQLYHNGNNLESEKSNGWISIMISFITILISFFIAKKLYEEYNPAPLIPNQKLAIGGWMILPAIGLVLTPFILLYQIATTGFFSSEIWTVFKEAGYKNANLLTIYTGIEFIYNIVFLVFTILLLILFFTKRTSFPKLIVIFYASNVVVPIIDHLLINSALPHELITPGEDASFYGEVTKSIIGAAIWIPYFLISERVKNTFYKTYKGIENFTPKV